MSLVTALISWAIVGLWLLVLVAVIAAYSRIPASFRLARVLLFVVAVDTLLNIFENCYFGVYFGSQYGLFSSWIAQTLGKPDLIILQKLLNIMAAVFVLGVLVLYWIPRASKDTKRYDSLQHAERRFSLLVAGVKEYAIYLLDPAGIVTSWNPGAERIKGYSAAEVLGVISPILPGFGWTRLVLLNALWRSPRAMERSRPRRCERERMARNSGRTWSLMQFGTMLVSW